MRATPGSERLVGPRCGPGRGIHVLAAITALALSSSPLRAQIVFPGRIAERVVSVTDSTQSYAVYLPSAYDASRQWPIVFLMDPRGRALVPLRLFKAAADRDGYILMSSYNTLSDGPPGPNVVAMNAMLGDAGATFSLDPRRSYLAGFSGTARVAWEFAVQLQGHVAGIFGASAGTASRSPWQADEGEPPPIAFYGTAGSTDFNYEEMQSFRSKVRAWGLPGRFRFFDGPHGWPPENLCAEALDWFTLQAMRRDLTETRSTFVDSLYVEDLTQADSLDTEGQALNAWNRLGEMLADYEGLHDLGDVQVRKAALQKSTRLREQVAERDRLQKRFVAYGRDLYAYLGELRERSTPADTAEIRRHLRITDLLKEARGEGPSAFAARRMLALALVQLSFYQPRDELRGHRPAYALPLLHVASLIRDRDPTVLLNLARAFSQAGRPDEALDALARVLSLGVTAARIRDDSSLVALHADPRFEELLRQGG